MSTEIDSVIQKAKDWVLSSVYPISSSYWVARDHPLAPIRVYYSGKWYLLGGFYDKGTFNYVAEIVRVDPSTNSIKLRYYFNLDNTYIRPIGGYTYPIYKLALELEVRNVTTDYDRVYIKVLRNDLGSLDLYWGTTLLKSNPSAGDVFSVDVPFPCYWCPMAFGGRYVARHSTRIGAWLIKDLYQPGTTPYNIAEAMERFMNDYGIIYEVYAPLWGKSNSYPDDYFDDYTNTWVGKGFSWLPWTDQLYPYRSRMETNVTCSYIPSIGALICSTALGCPSTMPLSVCVWRGGTLAKILKGLHLLNKYGYSSDVDTLISQALYQGQFDGYGFRAGFRREYFGMTFYYPYRAYPTYLTASFLAFLVRYYQATGKTSAWGIDILSTADRLARILMSLFTDYCANTEYGSLCFAHIKYGAPPAYRIGSVTAYPSGWGDITEYANAILDWTGILPVAPLDYIPFTNSESTILAAKALMIYKELGRTPPPLSGIIGYPSGIITGGHVGQPVCPNDVSYLKPDYMAAKFALSPGCPTWQSISLDIHTLIPFRKIIVGLQGRVKGKGAIKVDVDVMDQNLNRIANASNSFNVADQEIDQNIALDLGTCISAGKYKITLWISEQASQDSSLESIEWLTVKHISPDVMC